MAITTLTVQKITKTGLAPSYSAANADGHYVANNGRVFLHCKNTNAAARNVTIVTPNQVDGLAISDRTVTVPALTGDVMIGPFSPEIYGSMMTVTFDAVTDLTIAALQL